MEFETAIQLVLGHEGGYVNNPQDPGGETKYGISKRAHPTEDIKNLTIERAKYIYRRDYWAPAGCDAVPHALKYPLLDAAVNHGVRAAIRMLQTACGETPDGILGPLTIQAVQSMHPARLVARFSGARLEVYANLPTWPAFGKGWVRRVAANLLVT